MAGSAAAELDRHVVPGPEVDVARPTADRWALVGLMLLLAGVAGLRWRYLDIPLERDEGEFAYGGQLLLSGELPYQSLYAMKLPGIYVVYAAIMAIFGQTVRGIHLGLLLVNLASIALIYALARRLFDAATALVAAVSFAVLTFSAVVVGTLAQAEHFVVLPALAGIWLLLEAQDRQRYWLFFASGIGFGLALVVKQHGAAYLLFGLAYAMIGPPSPSRGDWRKRLAGALFVLAGGLLPLAATCLAAALLGIWAPFVHWTFTYPSHYVREESWYGAWFNLSRALRLQWVMSECLWAAAAVGVAVVALLPSYRPARRLVLLLLAASCLAMVPGGYFRHHYFLLLWPTLALASAVGLVACGRWLSRWGRGGQAAGIALVTGVLGWSVAQQLGVALPNDPRELSRFYYPTVFADAPEIARLIAENTGPQDRVAILGSEPELLFYARRRSATGHIYMYPLMERHPFALDMQKQAIREIEAAEPEVIVVCEFFESWSSLSHSHDALPNWSLEYLPAHYHPVARIELRGSEPARFCLTPSEIHAPPESESLVYIMRRNHSLR